MHVSCSSLSNSPKKGCSLIQFSDKQTLQLVKSCEITYEWPSLSSVLSNKRLTVRPLIPSLFPPTPSPLIATFVSYIFVLHFSYFISSIFSSVTFPVPVFCHSFPLETYPTKQSLLDHLFHLESILTKQPALEPMVPTCSFITLSHSSLPYIDITFSSSTLKMEAEDSSTVLVFICHATMHHSPEAHSLSSVYIISFKYVTASTEFMMST